VLKTLPQDVILGYRWLKENDIMPNCTNNSLVFPKNRNGSSLISNVEITRPQTKPTVHFDLKNNRLHEFDADKHTNIQNTNLKVKKKNENLKVKSKKRGVDSLTKLPFTASISVFPLPEKPFSKVLTNTPIKLTSYANLKHEARKSQCKIQTLWINMISNEEQTHNNELPTIPKPTIPLYLKQFKEVFDLKKLEALPVYSEENALPIDLEPGQPLPTGYPYRTSFKEEAALREVINKGLKSGHIEFSRAAGGCPVLFIKKPDDSFRMCVDYRKLNDITKSIQAILPNIHDIIASIPSTKTPRFSKIDLKGAFNQLRIKKGDEEKTTFTTKFGKFLYKVIPFGLKNAPGFFQAVMYKLFSHLIGNGMWIYLDDILVYEPDPDRHRKILEEIFFYFKTK
jgi:hypothetical protein